jgi:hypothetical protein
MLASTALIAGGVAILTAQRGWHPRDAAYASLVHTAAALSGAGCGILYRRWMLGIVLGALAGVLLYNCLVWNAPRGLD